MTTPQLPTIEISGKTWQVLSVQDIAGHANIVKAEPETVRWLFVQEKYGPVKLTRELRNGKYTHPVRL